MAVVSHLAYCLAFVSLWRNGLCLVLVALLVLCLRPSSLARVLCSRLRCLIWSAGVTLSFLAGVVNACKNLASCLSSTVYVPLLARFEIRIGTILSVPAFPSIFIWSCGVSTVNSWFL